MIFSVLPGTRVADIPVEATGLHFVRPVKKDLLEGLLKKCTMLEAVSASKSCFARMPAKSISLLKQKGIALETLARPGRPVSMPLEKMRQALEMRKDYQSLREVERVTGISKSTVHYLEKYAKRSKIKNGKKVIYLK
jgi:hypothetical protein